MEKLEQGTAAPQRGQSLEGSRIRLAPVDSQAHCDALYAASHGDGQEGSASSASPLSFCVPIERVSVVEVSLWRAIRGQRRVQGLSEGPGGKRCECGLHGYR